MRRTDPKRLEAIYREVEREPGIRPGRVAHKLGLHRTTVQRALPALDEAGLLLSEDNGGHLWPWRQVSR